MRKSSLWALLGCCALLSVPAIVVSQTNASAATTRKADWNTKKAKTTKAKASPTTKAKTLPKAPQNPVAAPEEPGVTTDIAATDPATQTTAPTAPPSSEPTNVVVQDQSQEVLDVDFAMAASIAESGPKVGYGGALSDEGVLFDSNGASPKGQEAATTRFASFPTDVSFVRTPEKAVAAGGSGSSWGSYTIKRGETVLSSGRYISVWRREANGWKMISELAAGRNAPTGGGVGVLPKRPAQLGRAAPAPVGVPLTIPATPAPPPAATETPPAP